MPARDVCYPRVVASARLRAFSIAVLALAMSSLAANVRADDSLTLALHKMDVGGYRHLPVVNADRPVGMISVRDMLRHVTGLCQ